ncbi:hypothetical protein [Flavobacterium sp.]|uniref:hypothetical protein n=1 Tax=Flavobacterium sp. TaxID=239 RepID=UPI0039E60C5C
MENNFDHILIFRTNIGPVQKNSALHETFDNHPDILHWSIDAEDSDCVLRIVSPTLTANEINALVGQHGFDCCELD